MAFFHCSLEVQCAIHCATEPGSGCFFYAPTATRTYLFPVSHRRPLRPLFTSSRGPTSVTTFDSSVGRAELNKQTSLGRWFDSGSNDELLFAGLSLRVKANGGQKTASLTGNRTRAAPVRAPNPNHYTTRERWGDRKSV